MICAAKAHLTSSNLECVNSFILLLVAFVHYSKLLQPNFINLLASEATTSIISSTLWKFKIEAIY